MLIDWQRIYELYSEIGAEDFDEIVEVFLGEVAGAIAGLDPKSGLPTLEADMHFIKSSAMNLGFSGLAGHCRAGEALAAGGKHPSEQVAGAQAVFDNSLREFSQGRASIATSA